MVTARHSESATPMPSTETGDTEMGGMAADETTVTDEQWEAMEEILETVRAYRDEE
jgi:Spy/CpxP family protein refolding chaperone